MKLSRRIFIKQITAAGILSQFPLLFSCNEAPQNEILPKNQRNTLLAFMEMLFPENNNISIQNINAYAHYNAILDDDNYDIDEKKFLQNGIIWTDETANKIYQKDFFLLNNDEQLIVFNKILQSNWGESWASRILTVIFEALLIDPLYKVNKNKVGWQWLQHTAGQPQPEQNNAYQKLLALKKQIFQSNTAYDVCVVGSGAGAGPIIYELSKAGYKVLVLEKGAWYKTKDFSKDELVATRRSVYTPNLKDERHVIEEQNDEGKWIAQSTYETGNDFWNGNCVGGSSNFMSGYFLRLKPNDFKLLSTYGAIKDANIVDWPISYEELEPYYEKVERIVGVSGKVVQHKFLEPRSTTDFPYEPLKENIVSELIDKAAKKLNIQTIPLPRAILTRKKGDRNACYYSNYCGSYGCASDAKGSSRVSLLKDALQTGNCKIIANAKVYKLKTDKTKQVSSVLYYDAQGKTKEVKAKIFVVAAQAIETSRLLLMSKNKDFPFGLVNNNKQVGKNLIFSAGGIGGGEFHYDKLAPDLVKKLQKPGVFVNRTVQQFYELTDKKTGKKIKGGTVDFLFEHANPVSKAIRQKWDDSGKLIYGKKLQNKLHDYFTNVRKLKFEIFVDWLPTDNCFVTLDDKITDKWGDPVAKVRVGYHPHDLEVAEIIAEKSKAILEEMGLTNIYAGISGAPPSNLQAGGCRFGNDPKTSVLNKNCQAHEVSNLFVTDGSFMPTGGSVTYTWTIYANSFRVAEIIKNKLKK